ncbi:MAG: GGDEF domain-containing protein [Mesorhizobium sp.]|nr:GGDEF domain-containing protein [Mesorhizobium sp.]
MFKRLDLSPTGKQRVYVLTVMGTLACMALAFVLDGYSFEYGRWELPVRWYNNIFIPLVVAPPFFYFLLSKLRELSLAHRELLSIAATDPLTNCLNRRAFTALVEGYLSKFDDSTEKGQGALLVLDVDHFKAVNDRFGHDGGDAALILIADTIKASVREPDLVARLGGEEFAVFLPGIDAAKAIQAAERIRLAVQQLPHMPRGQSHPLSLSIGGVTFEPPASFHDLYHFADQRLYMAKHSGRDRIDITARRDHGTWDAAVPT